MTTRLLLLIGGVVLWIAYLVYGKYLSRIFDLNDSRPTPAHTQNDGVDYVPTHKMVVLGHHFASIAGAGPIVGPILAVSFGWIPALLWILLGGIFFGAVQDISSLVASLRHQGKSIGEIIRSYIGDWGKRLFLIFSFLTLILVIAVFSDIVAKTFQNVPSSASSSAFFMIFAVIFGLFLRRNPTKISLASIPAFIIMMFLVWLGGVFPLSLSYWVWIGVLMVYVFISAVTPVWMLLQPRDFLNSFLLYALMIGGIIALIWVNPEIKMDNEIQYYSESLGFLFPVLFVTIACGAISGFHSLVASGTTAKQLDRESDAKLIGAGGMLIESFLAVIALSTVMIFSRADFTSNLAAQGPVSLFSVGLGTSLSHLGIPVESAISFVALTVSAFALTSLDTCTRLARYVLQEFFEDENLFSGESPPKVLQSRYSTTLITVVISLGLILSGGFSELWPIFGSANQLLGALALLAVSVWLTKTGIKPLFTLIPMAFMFLVTITSLFFFAWDKLSSNSYLLGTVAVSLIILSIFLLVLAKRSMSSLVDSGSK